MQQLTLEEAREIALKFEEDYSKIFRRFKIDLDCRIKTTDIFFRHIIIKISFTSLDSLSVYYKESQIPLEHLSKFSLSNILIQMVSSMPEIAVGK